MIWFASPPLPYHGPVGSMIHDKERDGITVICEKRIHTYYTFEDIIILIYISFIKIFQFTVLVFLVYTQMMMMMMMMMMI